MRKIKAANTAFMITLGLVLVCFPLPAAAEKASAPMALIEKTISDARDLIIAEKEKTPRNILEAKIKAIIYPVFDFREMSRKSLGKHWNKGTVEQQKEFVDLFSELLGENYLDTVIEGIDDCTIEYVKERLRKDRALVHTVIVKDDRIKVDYRLSYKDNKWRVYDVIIENIGLVSNYRNEFAGIIRKEKFSGLITQTREKVAKHREERAQRTE